MIATENILAASLYINNQLLSRGLLRDGQAIDFASLEQGDGYAAETSGRIISILNDLILRRDRDAEQRESLSMAMRNLRAENLRHTSDIPRLSEKCTEAQRKLDIATSSEASQKLQLKSAESAMRGLKDELGRTKALVSQSRAACAAEIRRRDRQIDSLKKQVGEAGRARGAKANSAVISIAVTGDTGGEAKGLPARSGSTTVEDNALRSETNSFLANLAHNLSEENEALWRVMQQTKDELREMSGWRDHGKGDVQVVKQPDWEELSSELDSVMDHMRTILTNPSFVPIEEVVVREEEINHLKAGWLRMESRWEDAVRLMDGWRKRMAASGKPICDEDLKLGLSLSPVRVNDIEETRKAREAGLPAVTEETGEDVDLVRSPCPAPRQLMAAEKHYGGVYEESEREYSGYEDFVPIDECDAEESNVQAAEQSAMMANYHTEESSPIPEPPQLSPQRNSSSAGNRGLQSNKVREKAGYHSTIIEENTRNLAEDPGPANPISYRTKPVAQILRPATKTNKPEERGSSASERSLDDTLLPNGGREAPEDMENSQPDPACSQANPAIEKRERSAGFCSTPRRIPLGPSRPRNSDPEPQQSPLTMSAIAAKLAASEKEADAARARARLRAVRATSGGVQRPVIASVPEQSQPAGDPGPPRRQDRAHVDPLKRAPVAPEDQQKPDKRKRERRTAKASSRRRSTLSPLELQTLISGNVQ